MLADLAIDLLVANVQLGANTGLFQRRHHLVRVVVSVGDNRRYGHLYWRQPQRQRAGILLDQNADEALQRAQNGPVQHGRTLAAAVFGDVLDTEAFRQVEVHLHRATLPATPDCVIKREFQLRAVERAITFGDHVVHAHHFAGLLQLAFGSIPDGIRADALLGTSRQLDFHLVEAQLAVHFENQLACFGGFGGQLFGRTENVGVIHDEATHAHQAMQRTGRFIPMAGAEFGHTQWQIPVDMQRIGIQLNMSRAVHRLDRQHASFVTAFIHLRDKHVLAVLVPVAGGLPKLAVHQQRRLDLDIVAGVDFLADIGLQLTEQGVALGVPEHLPHGFVLDMKQVKLFPEAAMVTFFRFFQLRQVGLEFLVAGPGRTVDALQHRVVGIPAPVGTGQLHQLERFAQLAGGRQMRPTTKVDELPLAVHRDGLALRQVRNNLGLISLALRLEPFDGLVAVPDFAGNRLIALDDLTHLRLDLFQIFRLKGLIAGEVVVEAILDGRPDRDLRIGVELLDGFGHHVGCVMAQQLQRLRRFARDDLDIGVLLDDAGQITHLAIHLDGQRGLGQTSANRHRHIKTGGRRIKGALGTVRQANGNTHGVSSRTNG